MTPSNYGVDVPPNPMQPTGGPLASGWDDRLRPSTAWYWVGGLIGVLGVGLAIFFGVRSALDVVGRVDDWPRVEVPGEAQIPLTAGSYRLYAEGPGFGMEQSFALPPDVTITDPRGRPVPVGRSNVTESYNWGNRSGSSFARFTAPMDGLYSFSTSGAASSATQVAVGEGLFSGVVGDIVLAVLVGGLAVVTSIIVLIVTGVRRGREKRRRNPPPQYGPPGGAGRPPDPSWPAPNPTGTWQPPPSTWPPAAQGGAPPPGPGAGAPSSWPQPPPPPSGGAPPPGTGPGAPSSWPSTSSPDGASPPPPSSWPSTPSTGGASLPPSTR